MKWAVGSVEKGPWLKLSHFDISVMVTVELPCANWLLIIFRYSSERVKDVGGRAQKTVYNAFDLINSLAVGVMCSARKLRRLSSWVRYFSRSRV